MVEQRTNEQRLDATFVEDMAERWIVIECRDAYEKQRVIAAIRAVLAPSCTHSWFRVGKYDNWQCQKCGHKGTGYPVVPL